MYKAFLFEATIIIVLIILILLVPGNRKPSSVEENSLMQEHVGRLADNSSVTENIGNIGNTGENQGNTSKENMLVSISRPQGGYTSFENGTFQKPAPLPAEDNEDNDDNDNTDNTDNNDNNDGASSDNDHDDSTSSDAESGSSSDNNDSSADDDNDSSSSEFAWTLKDPATAIDTGKRATTTAPLKLRSTPTIQTEDNVIDSLGEGRELVVTDASVVSTDPKVTNWVEVYYKGKIGYVSAKYVTIN